MALAKGSTLRTTLDFIFAHAGDESLGRVLERLAPAERHAVQATAPTDEIAFSLLLAVWRAADEVLGAADPLWVERAGAYSIESGGTRHYGGILKKASPLEFLTQPVSLFRLYYQPGNMEVVEQEPGRAVLRMVGFDDPHPLFCRRQTGGLQRALELAGGDAPAVRHVRCVLQDDAFCEWELAWK